MTLLIREIKTMFKISEYPSFVTVPGHFSFWCVLFPVRGNKAWAWFWSLCVTSTQTKFHAMLNARVFCHLILYEVSFKIVYHRFSIFSFLSLLKRWYLQSQFLECIFTNTHVLYLGFKAYRFSSIHSVKKNLVKGSNISLND